MPKSSMLQPKSAAMPEEALVPFIAVDLDGTLAEGLEDYSDPTLIGPPVKAMVEKVKAAIAAGNIVRVFTARLADEENSEAIKEAIGDYTEEHVGKRLDATNIKLPGMVEYWDDKARGVHENTGEFLDGDVLKTAGTKTAYRQYRRVPHPSGEGAWRYPVNWGPSDREPSGEVTQDITAAIEAIKQESASLSAEQFAEAVTERVPGAEMEEAGAGVWGDSPHPTHFFVKFKGRYYDAEAPKGVRAWRALPVFMTKTAKMLQPHTASPDFGYSQYNDREQELRNIKLRVTNGPTSIYVGCEQGYIRCEVAKNTTSPPYVGVEESNINHEWRGTGLGQILYEKVIQVAKRIGAEYLYSDVPARRSRAADQAWKRLGKRYHVEEVPGDYRLRLTLNPTASPTKTASPDFGYSTYNDREADIAEITFNLRALERGSKDAYRLRAMFEGAEQGYLDAYRQNGEQTWKVGMVMVHDEWRSTGLGQLLYRKMAAFLKKKGVTQMWSDESRSPAATAAWERLRNGGYPVTCQSPHEGGRCYIDLTQNLPAMSKAASPDFGYKKFNDREADLAKLKFVTKDLGTHTWAITAYAPAELYPYHQGTKQGVQVGYVEVHPDAGGSNDVVYVQDIAIEDDWKGTGLGQMLYEKAITKAKQDGMVRFESSVDISKDATKAWRRLKERFPVKRDLDNGNFFVDLARMAKIAAPRGMYFHGSSIKNLRSILSQGLIPDPKKRRWNETHDGHGDLNTPSLRSIGGIYVTQNLLTALGAPEDWDKEGRCLLVCMELQPNTFVLDEDSLPCRPSAALLDRTGHSFSVGCYYLAATLPPAEDEFLREGWATDVAAMKQDYVDNNLYRIGQQAPEPGLHSEQEEHLRKLLEDTWLPSLTRAAAQAFKGKDIHELRRCFWQVRGSQAEGVDALKLPTPAEAEEVYRKRVDLLTRALRTHTRPDAQGGQKAFQHNRVLEPIGYSGSNHITGVLEVRKGDKFRGESGNGPVPVIVHYGSVPELFKREWKSRMGSELDVQQPIEAAKAASTKIDPSALSIEEKNGMYFVTCEGQNIATASLSEKGPYLTVVHVEEPFRRRGVASTLYAFIEKHTGMPLEPSPTFQSDDAKAFWSSRRTAAEPMSEPELAEILPIDGHDRVSLQKLKENLTAWLTEHGELVVTNASPARTAELVRTVHRLGFKAESKVLPGARVPLPIIVIRM